MLAEILLTAQPHSAQKLILAYTVACRGVLSNVSLFFKQDWRGLEARGVDPPRDGDDVATAGAAAT
jgi:hypothetical protein